MPSVWTPASAAPKTLNDALSAAYSNNPVLLEERAHLRSIDENVPAALAGWRPTVVLNLSPGYAAGNFTSTGVTAPNNRPVLTEQATLTQPIYRGGRTKAAISQAENNVRAERSRLIATEEQVFSDTVNAFVTVIEDQQILALNINNVQVLARQLQATNDRFRVGEITRTDVAQAEAALAGAQAQRETAEGNLQTARATYRREVGELPDQLVEPQPLALPVKSAQDANQLAAVNNPNVIAAMYDEAAARSAIDTAFSALMPTLSLQGTGFREANTTLAHERSSGGMVTANITVPLYQGGSEYAAVRQARQNEQQSRKALDDARRAAIQSATQAWETLIAARATVDSTRSQIRANQVALEGVEREALVGSRTTLDVLNAQQALLSSQVTLVQNLAALLNASYQVAASIGRLTARDLALPVPLYDETAYYNAVRDRWFGTGDYATDQPGR
ncbi:MAG: TolC family outer membrane protein [Acidisphaera sp.]|nr:TolC family outer membrane protein [Acidisphaera sp.]